jgi:protein-tyrosine phosphatase
MLIEFYGKECPHCLKMAPLMDDLRKNIGVTIEQYEVWHDEDNLKKFREYDKGSCGGVPFFINTDTGKSICGETTYENLEKLAQGAVMAENHSPLTNIDFSYIVDGIYVGTNQCCRTHFEKELSKEGIEADISLEEGRIDAPFGIKFYIWLPIKNHESPTDEQFDLGVSILGKLAAMKKKVYVHCQNGHGRAPLLVAAYLVSTGKTPEEALSIVKSQRASTHLNDLQMKSLLDFSTRYGKS